MSENKPLVRYFCPKNSKLRTDALGNVESMKHIFTIHSPITYFCAANVVLREELAKEDVIFLYTGFVPLAELGLPVPSFYTLHQGIVQKLRTFNLVNSYDEYIRKITNGKQFQAYIDLAHYYQKILITHESCVAFHFIEEGMSSYIPPKTLNELTRIELNSGFRFTRYKEKFNALFRILRGYNLKLLALPYFANSFTFLDGSRYYGFSPAIYPGVSDQKKVILDAQHVHIQKQENTQSSQLSNAIVLIEESYFQVYNIQNADITYCLEQSLQNLKRELTSRPVFIKLRPGQKERDSIWKQYLVKHQIASQVLPGDLVLEELLIDSKHCKVVGTISALLYYASIFGHDSFSNYNFIPNRPRAVFDYLDFFWEEVQTLSNSGGKPYN